MKKLTEHNLFTIEDFEFLLENMEEAKNGSINDNHYKVLTKEDIAYHMKLEEIEKGYILRKLFEAVEEVQNVFNALEKIVFTKNALNLNKISGAIVGVYLDKEDSYRIKCFVEAEKEKEHGI